MNTAISIVAVAVGCFEAFQNQVGFRNIYGKLGEVREGRLHELKKNIEKS